MAKTTTDSGAYELRNQKIPNMHFDLDAFALQDNQNIVRDSFEMWYKVGFVFATLNLDATAQYMANPIFIRYAAPDDLAAIWNYRRHVQLGNAYRARHEECRRNHETDMLNSINKSWESNMKKCKAAIDVVCSIAPK